MLNNLGNAANQALFLITEVPMQDVSGEELLYVSSALDSYRKATQDPNEFQSLTEIEFDYLCNWAEEFIDLLICSRQIRAFDGLLKSSIVLAELYQKQLTRDEEIRTWYAIKSGELHQVVPSPSHKIRFMLDNLRNIAKSPDN